MDVQGTGVQPAEALPKAQEGQTREGGDVAQPVFGAAGVRVQYGDHTALDDVTIELHPGVTALLGENGAGKTTLLRVLATLQAPSAGRLVVDAAPLAPGALRQYRSRVGYLPQSVPALRHLTVAQYVDYFAYLKGLPRAAAAVERDRRLEQVGLTDRVRSRTTALSGGMRRRLGLAVALLGAPALLLLDEPTAGLDPVQRVDLRELVRDCGREAAVLLSTHLAEDVASLADRAAVLHAGRLVFSGSLPELTQPLSTDTTASSVEGAFLDLLGRRRLAGGPRA